MGVHSKEDYTTKRLFKGAWYLLRGYRADFFVSSFLILASHMVLYLNTYLLGLIVDFFISYQKGSPLNLFYTYVVLIALASSFQVIFRAIGKLRINNIGAKIKKDARILGMSKLMDLDLSWHENESAGSKMHKIQGGSSRIQDAFSFFGNDGLNILAGIIGSIFIFLFLEWKYGVFAISYAILFVSASIYFNKRVRTAQVRLALMGEKLSGKLHESAANILAVKALGLKESVYKSTKSNETAFYNVWLEEKKLSYNKLKVLNIITAIGYGIFLIMIGYDAANGFIQAATIFVIATYFSRLSNSMDMISNTMNKMIELQIGVGRIMLLLDEKTRQRESKDLAVISDDWKTVRVDNLSFRYKDKLVLRDFSLLINRGEKIGIVGSSGSGKSTISKLLLGLYEPIKGAVKFDGVPLDRIRQSSINDKVSIVLQDSEMFNQPLRDNISITGEDDPYLLRKAIKISNLGPVISKLPQGLRTLIGEKGYKLSGGERQRMGIARAVYRNADILIFDEATSHLDSKTESAIQKNLEKELRDKTMIIIAHRLSTLKNVDRIIVLEKGRIAEEGTFDELLSKKGLFYEAYKMQSRY